MKIKLIILIIIVSFTSIIIYNYTQKDEITVVALGDSISLGMTPYNIKGYSYNNYLKEEYENKHKLNKYYEFSECGKTVKELIYEIKENKKIDINGKTIELQRIINEADILTINIGMDELSEDKITKEIIKNYNNDIKELLNIIKKLNSKKVIIIGLFTIKKEELLNINKINANIRDKALINNFTFIDISTILNKEEYFFNKDSYYINYLGHKEIYKAISKSLKF